jgi:hypothetical protein
MPSSGRRLGAALGCAIVAAIITMAAFAVTGALRSDDDPEQQVTHAPEQALLVEDFEKYRAGQRWLDGNQYGNWRADYDGFGTTEVIENDGRRLSMSPTVAQNPEVTHAGLVTTVTEFEDIDLTAEMRTVRQLRPKAANPWEVAWLLWHYTDDNHFYSIVLKPNGWELGKEDPEYPGSQRYLITGDKPSFPIGVQHKIRVRHVGNSITVWANGRLLTTYTDKERPYFKGSVGLYTEDAEVEFDNVLVRAP